MPPEPAKVRTTLSAKPGSRRYQAVVLTGHYQWYLWKQQEIKSIKYSWLSQSYAPLPITTRALIPTLRTRKSHCQRQQNWPSSSIEQRLYLATSRWAKASEEEENIRLEERGNKRCLHNQRKYVQKTQRSQRVEDARRQLCQIIVIESSESSKKRNRSSIQDWLNLIPHCPSSLELWFQLSALESWHGQMQENWPSSSIEHRLYLAASRWVWVKKEVPSIRLKWERGGKSKW